MQLGGNCIPSVSNILSNPFELFFEIRRYFEGRTKLISFLKTFIIRQFKTQVNKYKILILNK